MFKISVLLLFVLSYKAQSQNDCSLIGCRIDSITNIAIATFDLNESGYPISSCLKMC